MVNPDLRRNDNRNDDGTNVHNNKHVVLHEKAWVILTLLKVHLIYQLIVEFMIPIARCLF